MIVCRTHVTLEELGKMVRREKVVRRHSRLRAVLLAMQGRDAPTIAAMVGAGRRSVQDWVRRFNERGIDGLSDRPRTGQPRRLTADEEAEICRRLDECLQGGPREGRPILRGPQIKRLIEEHFGKKMSVSGAYKLLHRLGYEPLRPRPRHPRSDPAAQEAFKTSASCASIPCVHFGRDFRGEPCHAAFR